MIFDGKEHSDFKLYLVISKKVGDMNFTLGGKNRIGLLEPDLLVWNVFANISKVVNDTVMVIAEYDGECYNAGVKISLNYNINIEIFIRDIAGIRAADEMGEFLNSYFVFGITYLQ